MDALARDAAVANTGVDCVRALVPKLERVR